MSAHFHSSLNASGLNTTNCSTGTAPAPRGWLATTLAVPGRLWREFRLRQATRRLEGLDDRMLGDIGISRADIDTVVRNGRPHRWNYL